MSFLFRRIVVITVIIGLQWHTNEANGSFSIALTHKLRLHCRISYREGLGMSPCIMGLTIQDLYILKEHTELYKSLKFPVNWANIEQGTATQKLKNLLTNVWIAGHLSGNPYIS